MHSQLVLRSGALLHITKGGTRLPLVGRQTVIKAILVIALLAFEVFNFDTTRFALYNLLGEAYFVRVTWAGILAVAFCAIDFAGLAHLCAPERERDNSPATWYLMAAWLLGATMNALMTWWAINLTLLNHSFGNEVLSRQQILELAPPFVAVLVWLTRILFIGAFALAADPEDAEDWPAEQPARLPLPGRATRTPASSAAPRPTLSSLPANRRPAAPPQTVAGRPAPRPPLPTMAGARTPAR